MNPTMATASTCIWAGARAVSNTTLRYLTAEVVAKDWQNTSFTLKFTHPTIQNVGHKIQAEYVYENGTKLTSVVAFFIEIIFKFEDATSLIKHS